MPALARAVLAVLLTLVTASAQAPFIALNGQIWRLTVTGAPRLNQAPLLGAVPIGQPVSQSVSGSMALLGLRVAVQGAGLAGNTGSMTGVGRNELWR
jgi:hypothetical protein